MLELKIATRSLTPEQESLLYKRANEGDEEAVEQLIYIDIHWIVQIAKGHFRSGITIEELISTGISALKRYYKSCKDNRFAAWFVQQSMLQLLIDKGLHPIKGQI